LQSALRQSGDLIFLEQRGTSKSNPNLKCDEEVNYPLDKPLELGELLRLYRESSGQCANRWRERGVDLTGYNTNESADDIEALRKSLGVEKLNLFGGSYGTHLALATVRRHETGINRVIIAGVEGPDHTYKLPSNLEKYLEQLGRIYRDDPVVGQVLPDLIGSMKKLLERLEKQPVTVEATLPGKSQKVKVTVGKVDLLFLLSTLGDSVDSIRAFPATAYAMSKSDFTPLAQFSLSIRRTKIESAMSYMMDCASGVSKERWARILDEEKGTLIGRLVDFPFPEICEQWGAPDLGPVFRSPIKSEVPLLLISGTLDGRTPVSNAEEIQRGFPNSTAVIVEGAGHDSLLTPQTGELMLQFLKGIPISTRRIPAPPLKLKLSEARPSN